MSENKAIVLPIDFSDLSMAALPWAERLANMTGGSIHCIYAVEPPQVYSALDMAPAVPLPSSAELVKNAGEQLEAFAAKNLPDAETTTAVLTGKPAAQIVAYADQVNAAMIVMTTHGYSGLEHMLLGSTTEAVLRRASCPVLSIRNS